MDLRTLEIGDAAIYDPAGPTGPCWKHYLRPVRVVEADELDDVNALVEHAEAAVDAGRTVLLVLAYEAAPAFDPALETRPLESGPLAWAAEYDSDARQFHELLPLEAIEVDLDPPEWSEPMYVARAERVRNALEEGRSYQVNLTFRQPFRLRGSAAALFVDRCGVDPPPFAAYIRMADRDVCSFSPELLFERMHDRIVSRPMKGTAPRPERQRLEAARQALKSDPKSISENVMIVDMVRHELGAVCEIGSIAAPQLLDVEVHRNLLQMTSTLTGRTSAPTSSLLRALFPAASVTGAPKVETSRLIAELETSPRGNYCGAIGLLKPEHQRVAVGIRTAEVRGGSGVFGIGSGIVWESDLTQEYAECLSKRDLLVQPGPRWELREALAASRLDDDAHVERHLERMAASARHFGVPWDANAFRAAILAALPPPEGADKLSIALGLGGNFRAIWSRSRVPTGVLKARLAPVPLSSSDPRLRHKTSSRAQLDGLLDLNADVDEVLCHNEFGRLTEFCLGNVVVEIDGELVTPPPDEGCLPGIGVQELIEKGSLKQAPIPITYLAPQVAIWFVNSVVGLRRVELEFPLILAGPSAENPNRTA